LYIVAQTFELFPLFGVHCFSGTLYSDHRLNRGNTLALIQCSDCDSDISDRAPSCIHCGAPAAKGSAKLPGTTAYRFNAVHLMGGMLCLLLVVIGYKVALLFYNNPTQAVSLSVYSDASEAISNTRVRGPLYDSFMRSESHKLDVDEKSRYALMVEKEIVINRALPRMLNPFLKFTDANYKHSTREMDYTFQATANLEFSDAADLNHKLQKRYCTDSEFRDQRENSITVNWIYWSNKGTLLHRYSSRPCGNTSYASNASS
jgi:hypothetical protein